MVSTRLGAVAAAGVLVTACSGPSPLLPTPLAAPGGTIASAMAGPEYADVSNQGGPAMGTYAPKGASLLRQPNGLQLRLTMPTPAPGSYNYPAGFAPGHPEVFTLWVFIFNYPDLCSGPCDTDDLGVDKPAKGTVYNGAGHPSGGGMLTLAGRVGIGDMPFAHPVLTLPALESPSTAEVHLAVAPHGGLDPATLPDEFRLPSGNPSFWWVAIFK
jgi:hypothetical protein